MATRELLLKVMLGLTKKPISKEAYLEYTKQKYDYENAYFMDEVLKLFKKEPTTKMKEYLQPIQVETGSVETLTKEQVVQLFLSANGEYELNLSEQLRSATISEVNKGYNADSLLTAFEHIVDLSLDNKFKSFIQENALQNLHHHKVIQIKLIKFIISLVLSLGALVLMGVFLPFYYRFLLAPLMWFTVLSYLEYKMKFCIKSARKKVQYDKSSESKQQLLPKKSVVEEESVCKLQKNRRSKVILISLSVGTLLTAISGIPYQ